MSEPAFDIHQLQNMDFIEEQWEKWKDETDFNKFECVFPVVFFAKLPQL